MSTKLSRMRHAYLKREIPTARFHILKLENLLRNIQFQSGPLCSPEPIFPILSISNPFWMIYASACPIMILTGIVEEGPSPPY